jgi:hypothetical protein
MKVLSRKFLTSDIKDRSTTGGDGVHGVLLVLLRAVGGRFGLVS